MPKNSFFPKSEKACAFRTPLNGESRWFSGLLGGFRAVRLRRASFLRGHCAAGGGGGASSSYFKYSAPDRNAQARARRLAPLGGSRVLYFRAHFESAVSHLGKRNFWASAFALPTNH